VLSERQFDLKNLPEEKQFPLGSVYKVEITEAKDGRGRFIYVIIYTGDNLDWLRFQNEQPT
jgi:hypothetical protein